MASGSSQSVTVNVGALTQAIAVAIQEATATNTIPDRRSDQGTHTNPW